MTALIREKPLDVGLIGIGKNAYIAFNDPPVDFETDEAYKVVKLDEKCRTQQFREGWFVSLEEVPTKAISITVYEILTCRHIICAVPYSVKAQAVYDTVHVVEVTPLLPSTVLRRHEDVTVYVDPDSRVLLLDNFTRK